MKLTILSILLCIVFCTSGHAQKISGDWPEISMLHALLVQSIQNPDAKKIDPNYDLVDDIAVRTVRLLKGNIPADYRTGHVFSELQKLQSRGIDLHEAQTQKLPTSVIVPIEIDMHATLDELLGSCGLQLPVTIQK